MPPDWKEQLTKIRKYHDKLSEIERGPAPESHNVFERPVPPKKEEEEQMKRYVQEGAAIFVPPLSDEILADVIEVQKLVKVRAQVFAEQRRKIQELDALNSYLSQICRPKESLPSERKKSDSELDTELSDLINSFKERREELKQNDNTRALRRVMATFAESARAAALTTKEAHDQVQKLLKREFEYLK